MLRKKIFLTGGNGFIGKNILEILSKKYEILSPGRKELNLLDLSAVLLYLKMNQPDIILHAASVGVSRNNNQQANILRDNLSIFYNLLSSKKYYKRMIVFGSGAEYDKRKKLVNVNEVEFGNQIPIDDYGLSKFTMSKIAENNKFITHLRFFAVFGKYEEYRTRFISNSICKALLDLPITINQNVFFDYIYVEDAIKIIDKIIEKKPKEIFYNIGSGRRIDLVSLAKIILKITKKNLPIIINKEGLNNEYTCNISKLKNELNGLEFTDLHNSISELAEYYKNIISKLDKKLFLKNF